MQIYATSFTAINKSILHNRKCGQYTFVSTLEESIRAVAPQLQCNDVTTTIANKQLDNGFG